MQASALPPRLIALGLHFWGEIPDSLVGLAEVSAHLVRCLLTESLHLLPQLSYIFPSIVQFDACGLQVSLLRLECLDLLNFAKFILDCPKNFVQVGDTGTIALERAEQFVCQAELNF